MPGRKIRTYAMYKWLDVHRAASCQQARDQCHLRHASRFGSTYCSGSWLQQEMMERAALTTIVIMLPFVRRRLVLPRYALNEDVLYMAA
jgi:hypothetical protein